MAKFNFIIISFVINNAENYTGKGKVFPVLLTEHHAMKAYWGSGGIALLIL
jgi:hypothetical protein